MTRTQVQPTGLRNSIVLLVAMLVTTSTPAFAQVDFSGEWRSVTHETGGDAEIGDYTGLSLNHAGRLAAETWDASIMTVPELQCRPHPAPYAQQAPGNPANAQFRWAKVLDPVTQATIAYHKRGAWMEPERTIWMDGRPHPPEYAPHTWQGFSTGRWEGNTLTITTTHLKEGYIRRNGVPTSDRTVMTEYLIRHGNYFTQNLYVEDPVYLTEPYIETATWVLDPGVGPALQQRYPCGPNEIAIEIPRPRGVIPHHLPGTNNWLIEFAVAHGLPFEATRGEPGSVYPEYMQKVNTMKPATAPTAKATTAK